MKKTWFLVFLIFSILLAGCSAEMSAQEPASVYNGESGGCMADYYVKIEYTTGDVSRVLFEDGPFDIELIDGNLAVLSSDLERANSELSKWDSLLSTLEGNNAEGFSSGFFTRPFRIQRWGSDRFEYSPDVCPRDNVINTVKYERILGGEGMNGYSTNLSPFSWGKSTVSFIFPAGDGSITNQNTVFECTLLQEVVDGNTTTPFVSENNRPPERQGYNLIYPDSWESMTSEQAWQRFFSEDNLIAGYRVYTADPTHLANVNELTNLLQYCVGLNAEGSVGQLVFVSVTDTFTKTIGFLTGGGGEGAGGSSGELGGKASHFLAFGSGNLSGDYNSWYTSEGWELNGGYESMNYNYIDFYFYFVPIP